MNDISESIRKELKKNSDEKTKASGKHFFKEKIDLYGVKTSEVSRIGKEYFKVIKDTDKAQIFGLCEELWKSGMMEESFIACQWSYCMRKKFNSEDIKIFEHWVDNYVTNWASCDTLCNHTIGTVVEMYPENMQVLKRWAFSENRWMRRASAVSLIVPARNGLFPDDIFEIASILLMDKDDMVQKGYGWMLKAASKVHEKRVFDFVMSNKKEMPRTALRYAIEKMPGELKKRAMDRS
jgi:3-methyladenine DNA glycosylase AlkD